MTKRNLGLYIDTDRHNKILRPPINISWKKMGSVDPLWASWFSGLIDGEGSFAINKSPTGMSLQCELGIAMRADEIDGFREIINILGCGRIHIHTRGENGKNPMRKWRVRDIDSIHNRIIPMFDLYPLRMKKKREYTLWREAALIIYDGGHMDRRRDRVLELKNLLHKEKKYHEPETI